MNSFRITLIRLGQDGTPAVLPITTISADDNSHLVTHGNFIQPDFVGIPENIKSNLTIFTWYEVPSSVIGPVKVKGSFFNHAQISKPFSLSRNNNTARTIGTSVGVGDYSYGAFFMALIVTILFVHGPKQQE